MSSNRSWLWGVVGAAVAVVVTLGVVQLVGVDDGEAEPTADETPTTDSPSSQSSPAATPAKEPSSAPTSTFTVAAYYLGDTGRGAQLFREFRRAEGANAGAAAVRAALGNPADPDYRSPWSGLDITAASVSGDADLVAVDLSVDDVGTVHERPPGMDGRTAQLAIEQLMRTAQGALESGRAPVQFLVNGQHLDTILGVPTSEPLANADDLDVLAHVWIDDPVEGAHVSAGGIVKGLANSFEATVTWELRQGSRVVKRGFTTASEAFTMAPYSFKLPQVPAGEYTLVVSEDDPSGGAEGSGPDRDTRTVRFG
jgi:hypothetical protein